MKISKLKRIYISETIVKNQNMVITEEKFLYLKSVMRFKDGDKIRVFNENDGEFIAKITCITKSYINIFIESFFRPPEQEQELILAMCIIKQDRMIEAIKSVVALGVTKIIPIISEYTQYKKLYREKIQKIIIGATEQSERFTIASLLPEIKLSDFCKNKDYAPVIFANESEKNTLKINCLEKECNKVTILIGPEGGFSDNEINFISNYDHINSFSLGKYVLRSELAAISLVSNVNMIRNFRL